MTTKLDLELPFAESERGNNWFTSNGGLDHAAWIHIKDNYWFEVTVNPDNYPGLHTAVVELTKEQLREHIQKNLVGWFRRKCNIDGVVVDINHQVKDLSEPEEEDGGD